MVVVVVVVGGGGGDAGDSTESLSYQCLPTLHYPFLTCILQLSNMKFANDMPLSEISLQREVIHMLHSFPLDLSHNRYNAM